LYDVVVPEQWTGMYAGMQEVEQWDVGKIDMPTGFSPQKKCYLCKQKQTDIS
jgi:hypothetical protein